MFGVIKVRIREVAETKGVKTAYQLQKLTGVQATVAAKWYKNDLKSIAFDSLDLLCNKLNCMPADLIAYEK